MLQSLGILTLGGGLPAPIPTGQCSPGGGLAGSRSWWPAQCSAAGLRDRVELGGRRAATALRWGHFGRGELAAGWTRWILGGHPKAGPQRGRRVGAVPGVARATGTARLRFSPRPRGSPSLLPF